jgi:hypothetical protein
MKASEIVPDSISSHRYLEYVPRLTWHTLNATVWETIQEEGLDEEFSLYNPTDWEYAVLPISTIDSNALTAFDTDAIEDFNRFDIGLKNLYNDIVDLINYDNGTVILVKPSSLIIKEIDHANFVEESTLSDDEIMAGATHVAILETAEIFKSVISDSTVYFTKDNNSIGAYALFENGNILKGVRNRTGVKGAVSILVSYVAMYEVPEIVIDRDEMFSDQGFAWLKKFVIHGMRHMNFYDNSGNEITISNFANIEQEWKSAQTTGNACSTEIIIRAKNKLPNTITEGHVLKMPRLNTFKNQYLI